MSWGYKIVVVYSIFVGGILFLVYRSSKEDEALVTTNYYEKELAYQQKIDIDKRTAALQQPFSFERQGGELVLHFPKDLYGKKLNGEVKLYCPSDEHKDQSQPFELADAGMPLHFTAKHTGMNILQVSWQADGLWYYYEKKIVL